ncbi:MAG: hypothetical protein K2M70_14410, partial [Lachnospiraceae bacterium]|nr:hypothetical protein [Lachnospiraceae bacterium]
MEKNNTQQQNSNIIKRIVIFTLLFPATGVIAWLGSMLYQSKTDLMIRNVVMILAGTGIVIFSFVMSEINGFFIYRNEGRYGRFSLTYLIILAISVFLPYLP